MSYFCYFKSLEIVLILCYFASKVAHVYVSKFGGVNVFLEMCFEVFGVILELKLVSVLGLASGLIDHCLTSITMGSNGRVVNALNCKEEFWGSIFTISILYIYIHTLLIKWVNRLK